MRAPVVTGPSRRRAVTPLWIESVGQCWGSRFGVASLVDDEGRYRPSLPVSPFELDDAMAAVARARRPRRRLPLDARTVGIYLVERPDGAPGGLALAVDGSGRRAVGCRAVEAVCWAADAGLPLWIAEHLLVRWGVPIDRGRGRARVGVPPAFHRLIAEELAALDAL
jgi:hypothetical protein